MLYTVGSRVDLRELNDSVTPEPKKEQHDRYISGTKISFLKMAKGLIVTDVNEPVMSFRVAVLA